jgi:tRNA pseudouridine55 synthase
MERRSTPADAELTVAGRADSDAQGLLLVDKPAGVTSHDVVARVRRSLRTRRVGHAGTLDPFATGLLVCAVGPSTRLLAYLDGEPKVYRARVQFGVGTDTDDATGTEVARAGAPDWGALKRALAGLSGALAQRPPAYSAKHVDGERAYARARRGDAVALPPVAITVHGWRVLDRGADWLEADVTCSGGTYVRALARDLGEALGTVAHCATLRRLASGPLRVEDAVPMSALDPDAPPALRSPLVALTHLARERLDPEAVADVRQGRAVRAEVDGARAVLVQSTAGGEAIVAIADRQTRAGDAWWQPRVVLPAAREAE